MPRYDRDYGRRFEREYGYDYRWSRQRRVRPARFGPLGWETFGDTGDPRRQGYGEAPSGRGYDRAFQGYTRDPLAREWYDRDFGWRGYDAVIERGDRHRRRARSSRWRTDYGDPFHDRERRTPIRAMRGQWQEHSLDYDDAWRARGPSDRPARAPRSRRWW